MSLDLGCSVVSLTYVVGARLGIVRVPEYSCVDMTATVALFVAIDPDVEHIETWAGDVPDVVYVRDRRDWRAILPSTA